MASDVLRQCTASFAGSKRPGGNELLYMFGDLVGLEIIGRQVKITSRARLFQALQLFGARGRCPI
jgi:hypothetical protein